MTQYTKVEIKEILKKHRLWLDSEDGGEHADLRGANLRGAYLGDANLRGANLRGAYLGDADLRGADLRGANLRDANLGGADLRGADLRGAYLGGAYLGGADLGGADLREIASLWGASGNCHEVKAIQADLWPVTYTATQMQIGCQLHRIDDWWAFNDGEINAMDSEALNWWRIWKPILRQIIETSPCQACAEKADEESGDDQ